MSSKELNCFLGGYAKIELLGLSKRVITALKRTNINTIEDLIKFHQENNLSRIRNLGVNGIKEIETVLKEKSNIIINKEISELEKLGLSIGTLNILINKYKVSTIKEILEIPLDKKYHPNFYLDNSTKYGKETIDKIHSMGLKFKCEEKQQKERTLKKEDKIELLDLNTKLYRTLRSAGIVTIEDLLKKYDECKLERIRNLGINGITEIKEALLNKCNIKIDDETKEEVIISNEEPIKQLFVTDSIYELGYYRGLTRNMKCYGINTIGDLLKLSTNEFVTRKERGVYNIRGFGKEKVKHLINYVHSKGFVFENEKAILEKNNTLENLYKTFDKEFVFREFYEKINVPEDFLNNAFVLYFIRLASNVCVNEYNGKYLYKEIVIFLNNKLMEHKKKMLDITNNISMKLVLKNR